MRCSKDYFEYILARGGFGLMGHLPYDMSLRTFGTLFAKIGPRLSAHKRILDNLDHAGDALGDFDRDHLARDIWRNFGQTLTDLAHLDDLRGAPERIVVEGADILEQLKADGRPILFFSAHIACWEVIRIAAQRHGITPSILYRRFNNPFVDAYARKVQHVEGVEVLTKSASGARDLIRLMTAKKSALLLLDQHFTGGKPVDFLGKPAMTASAIAELGLKYGAEIVPVHVVRLPAGHHKVVFSMPLSLNACENLERRIILLLQQINTHISTWVIENPQQWFWLHRRWKGLEASVTLGAKENLS